MTRTTTHHAHLARTCMSLGLALAVIGLGAAPSSARQDAGPMDRHVSAARTCPLQRVDTQFVRCDDLTGNGVPAPSFISSR